MRNSLPCSTMPVSQLPPFAFRGKPACSLTSAREYLRVSSKVSTDCAPIIGVGVTEGIAAAGGGTGHRLPQCSPSPLVRGLSKLLDDSLLYEMREDLPCFTCGRSGEPHADFNVPV